jgi:hypothetical protein
MVAPQGRKERNDMNARDMIVEAGFLSTKAASKVLEEKGLTEKARLLAHRLDDLALQLLKLAREIEA